MKGFAIINMDLTATEDGNLCVPPTNPTGNLRVEIQFEQVNEDVTIFYIGEFQNELLVQMDQVPYLTYTYPQDATKDESNISLP